MALAESDIQYIKEHLGEWLAEQSLGKPPAVYEVELRERMVRVEEELKHQRELMLQGFQQSEKRFEQVDAQLKQQREEMNARFIQVDAQLKQQRDEMNARFEQVDKRFEQMDKRFEQMDKRFEQVDKRFEQVDKRFEQADKRFEQFDKRFDLMTQRIDRFMVWSFGTTVAVGGIVISVLKFWN